MVTYWMQSWRCLVFLCIGRTGTGGGVMVYVSNDVKAVRRGDLEEVGIEALWIEVKTSKKRMLVCNVYRPPDAKVEWIDELAGMIEHGVQEEKTVVVLGDFKCDMLRPNSHACKLGMVISDHGLEQLGNGPTRVTENSSTQIDLLFSTSCEVFQHVGSEDPGLSDHSLIYGMLTCRVQGNKQELRKVRCLRKCDIEKLVSGLDAAPWSVMDALEDVDCQWDYWKNLFNKIVDSHVPMKKAQVRMKSLP